MSYMIVNPPTATLQPNELQITLDTGQSVAVLASATRQPGGGATVTVTAREINGSGATVNDANGHGITSAVSHSFDAATIASATLPACIKDCSLLALGEPTLLFGVSLPALDPSVIASYSIRNAIASAAHAGPVTDLASVL